MEWCSPIFRQIQTEQNNKEMNQTKHNKTKQNKTKQKIYGSIFIFFGKPESVNILFYIRVY